MAFWLWIACAVAAAAIAAALLSSIRIRVRYSRSGRLDQLVVVVQALYGLFRYQLLFPSIVVRGWNVVYKEKAKEGLTGKKERNERKAGERSVRRYFRAYRSVRTSTYRFNRWARRSLKKVECTRWRMDVRVGTGDAASTATAVGLLWALSGCATGLASTLLSFRAPARGEVEPNYKAPEFTLVWEADFRLRFGTLLWAVLRLGTNTIRIGKAIRAWRALLAPPPNESPG